MADQHGFIIRFLRQRQNRYCFKISQFCSRGFPELIFFFSGYAVCIKNGIRSGHTEDYYSISKKVMIGPFFCLCTVRARYLLFTRTVEAKLKALWSGLLCGQRAFC